MSGPYISHFRVHADMTIACLRYLLTCRPLISGVVSGATHDHIIKGFHDIFPYVHEFWPDHLLSYSKDLHAHSDEEKRIKTVQDLLRMLSSFQNRSTLKVLDSRLGAAAIEGISLDVESSLLRDFPPAIRQYIMYRKRMPVRQTSSTNDMDSNSNLAQIDLNWIPAAYKTFQTEFESLLSAAHSFDCHEMSAKYCQMTANWDDIHKFKLRHGKSAFLCRWSGCIWASAGFQSTAEREKHETTHTRRFRCSDPSCDFAQNGFSSRHALKKHTLKYHTRAEDLILPAFPIPKSRFGKSSKDSHTSAHMEEQSEVKTSESFGDPFFSDLNDDVLENFDFQFDSFSTPISSPPDKRLSYQEQPATLEAQNKKNMMGSLLAPPGTTLRAYQDQLAALTVQNKRRMWFAQQEQR